MPLAASLLFFVQCPWKSCGLNLCVATNTAPLVQGAGSMLFPSVDIPMQIVIVVEYKDPVHQQIPGRVARTHFLLETLGYGLPLA